MYAFNNLEIVINISDYHFNNYLSGYSQKKIIIINSPKTAQIFWYINKIINLNPLIKYGGKNNQWY